MSSKIMTAMIIVASLCGHLWAASTDNSKPVILLTGFEPFGGSSFNTSWDVVSAFDGQEIAGHLIKTVRLQVLYDQIDTPLLEALEKNKPVAVIAFGEGTREIQIEKVARNGYHLAHPKDNDGKAPPRDAIVPGGPATIRTGLPVDVLLQDLKAAGMKATVSSDAGGYLCNECFYRLMSAKDAPARRGFIHLPVVQPSETAARKQLDDALRVILKRIIETKE